jgi:hypothetical protein
MTVLAGYASDATANRPLAMEPIGEPGMCGKARRRARHRLLQTPHWLDGSTIRGQLLCALAAGSLKGWRTDRKTGVLDFK